MDIVNIESIVGFGRSYFQNTFNLPTEFQLNTWENDGGFVFGAWDEIVLVNGILCRTWSDRARAAFRPRWIGLKLSALVSHRKH